MRRILHFHQKITDTSPIHIITTWKFLFTIISGLVAITFGFGTWASSFKEQVVAKVVFAQDKTHPTFTDLENLMHQERQERQTENREMRRWFQTLIRDQLAEVKDLIRR